MGGCGLVWCVVLCVVEEIALMVGWRERDGLGAAHRGFICTLGGVLGSDIPTW